MTIWRWALLQHSPGEDKKLMAELIWTPQLRTGVLDGYIRWGQGPQGILTSWEAHKDWAVPDVVFIEVPGLLWSSPPPFIRLGLVERILLPHSLGVLLCETIMKTKQWFGVCLLFTTHQFSALPFFPPSCQATASGTEPSQRRAQCCWRGWLRDKTFRCCVWLV